METEKNFMENISHLIRRSVTLKLFTIFILMVILMIPMEFARDVIYDRENLQETAITEVSNMWAGKQDVYGPILTIPYKAEVIADGKRTFVLKHAHIFPDKLNIISEITPQTRSRGIFDVVVYTTTLSLNGNFEDIQQHFNNKESQPQWNEAFLTFNVTDLKGFSDKALVDWNGMPKQVEPGTLLSGIGESGITIHNVFSDTTMNEAALDTYTFKAEFKLQGSQYLGFIPLGRETTVKITSPWKDPSFTGNFLPDTRTITKNGFTADYKILEINRNYPQFYNDSLKTESIKSSAFGVDLLIPANGYQSSHRAAKYALLAISLTFLTFFLVEIFNKQKVHPFQYILIGLALVIYYVLLVSLSEFMVFGLAYLLASLVVISMISLYARSILKNDRQALALTMVLSITYIFVYVTLRLQDYALLIGSIGLVITLAITMYITRKINWYELK